MRAEYLHPPSSDEIEVSVFGPGYGEAILIHIGNSKWILIDSCIEPNSKFPVSLKYLENIGFVPENSVELIVVTHWHDDHIRGISSILNICQSAKIAVSNALNTNEFLTLAKLHLDNSSMLVTSGIDEFTQIFQILEERKRKGVRFNAPRLASADKLLYRENIQLTSKKTITEVKAYSLSPSDAAILQAQMAFTELLPKEDDFPKRVTSLKPNHTSVALWLEIGERKLLLGADLEITSDPQTGWSVILSDSTAISGNAEIFKIPHHGSKNAHHEGVWLHLLSREPVAVVTPFNKGRNPLPSPEDVRRINNLTPLGYATAPTRQKSQKWRNPVVRDFVKQVTKRMRSVNQGWGHIRLRHAIDETDNEWRVELFGDAYALNSFKV